MLNFSSCSSFCTQFVVINRRRCLGVIIWKYALQRKHSNRSMKLRLARRNSICTTDRSNKRAQSTRLCQEMTRDFHKHQINGNMDHFSVLSHRAKTPHSFCLQFLNRTTPYKRSQSIANRLFNTFDTYLTAAHEYGKINPTNLAMEKQLNRIQIFVKKNNRWTQNEIILTDNAKYGPEFWLDFNRLQPNNQCVFHGISANQIRLIFKQQTLTIDPDSWFYGWNMNVISESGFSNLEVLSRRTLRRQKPYKSPNKEQTHNCALFTVLY